MSVTLNLEQARELLDFFGDEEADVTVRRMETGGHSGPGIYVHLAGHPEEGSVKLSDELDEPLSDDLWTWLTDGVRGLSPATKEMLTGGHISTPGVKGPEHG